MNAPVFGLIVIGDEILSGRRSDKHLHNAIILKTPSVFSYFPLNF